MKRFLLRRQIEKLPPYPALLILALAVVEPLKFATIFVAGNGHWITAGLVMLFAYAVSLFVTHRLFQLVKPKLLTLPWFARSWAWFVAARKKTWRWISKRAVPMAVAMDFKAGGPDGGTGR
jgi:hypothetical protein